jgi:ATP-binding cassette subfamily B (MDR/TAP) protein 1
MNKVAPEPAPAGTTTVEDDNNQDNNMRPSLADVDALPDIKTEDEDEDPKAKEKREKEELKAKMAEFGKPIGMRKMCSFASSYELMWYAFGWLGAIAHGFGAPALCIIFGDMIDSMDSSKQAGGLNMDKIEDLALQFALIGIGVIITSTFQGLGFGWFAEVQANKIRPLYFQAALHRDVGWFDTHDIGSFPAEMSQDIEDLQAGLGAMVGITIMSFSQLIFGYLLGFIKGWLLAIVIFVTTPFMAVGAAIMMSAMMDIQMETQGAYQQAAKVVEEVLFAIRTVVAFGGEHRELARFSVQVDKAKKGGIMNRVKVGAGMGYTWGFLFLSYAIAFFAGMMMRYHGIKDPVSGEVYGIGRILSVFFAVLTGGFSLGQMPTGLQHFSTAKVSGARIFWVIETVSEIQRIEDNRKDVGPIEDIVLKDVHFNYPARPEQKILVGLNLTIRKGQKIAVVGESGSGKSTVMALIERFYDPSSGAVLINGTDLREFSVKKFRRQIGYVGQEPVLFATTMRNNIMQGCPTASEDEFQAAVKNAEMREFVDKLPDQFETFVGSGGSQFSGGQKQRIAIARALLKNPSLLYLDEATSALDSNSEKMIQGTIDYIGSNSNLGMTIVSIAHRLSTIRNSDVIYVLQMGQVAEFGSHNELLEKTDGLYKALAAAQEMAGESDDKEKEKERQQKDSKKEKEMDAKRQSSSNKLGKATSNQFEIDEEKELEKKIAKEYKVPFRRILDLCRAQWVWFFPGILSGAVNGCMFPLLGSVVLVDAMFAFMSPDKDHMRREVLKGCAWFCAGAVLLFFVNIGQFGSFGVIGESLTRNVRVNLLQSVMRQEIGYHDDSEHTPSILAKAFQTYANRMANLLNQTGDKINALGSVLCGAAIAFAFCWEMASGIVLCVPFLVAAQAVAFAATMGGSKEANSSLNKAQQILSDAVTNARTVQACGSEFELKEMYETIVRGVGKGIFQKNLIGGVAFGVGDSMQYFVMGFGFWFLGFLIEKDRTDFTKGMKAFLGLLFGAMGAGMAASMLTDGAKAKVAAQGMFALLDRTPQINGLEPEGETPESNFEVGFIEMKEVSFFYPFRPDVQVLKSLSFAVEAGTSVGLVGPSGGGKSTVMAMIQRFYDPQGGEVLLGAGVKKNLRSLNIRWWRSKIGFVGQEPILFEGTVMHNVRYGIAPDAKIEDSRLAECKRMANLHFLDKANGWDTQVGPKGNRLSGGQKQRVAICRALIRDPPIMLLDEATSALDSQSEQIVSRALEAARANRTSFAIAHRLSTIQDCDTIMVVGEGRILERGAHQELMELQGVYHKLQAQGGKKR